MTVVLSDARLICRNPTFHIRQFYRDNRHQSGWSSGGTLDYRCLGCGLPLVRVHHPEGDGRWLAHIIEEEPG